MELIDGAPMFSKGPEGEACRPQYIELVHRPPVAGVFRVDCVITQRVEFVEVRVILVVFPQLNGLPFSENISAAVIKDVRVAESADSVIAGAVERGLAVGYSTDAGLCSGASIHDEAWLFNGEGIPRKTAKSFNVIAGFALIRHSLRDGGVNASCVKYESFSSLR